MDTKDIISKKNELIELVQSIVSDYHLMNDKLLQQRNLSLIEMKSMNDVILEQERMSHSEFSEKQDMENEIKVLKKQINEYEGMIRDLQDKLLEKKNEEDSGNKFNLMITQANELEAKDREIERLNKLVLNLKHPKEEQVLRVDSLVNEVKQELLKEDINEDTTEDINEDTTEDINEVLTFTYRKKTYYYNDNDNNVYDSNTLENCIGKYGKTKTGRMKLI